MQGNHTLVTGGYDGLIVVWNTDSGAVSAHLSPSSQKRTGLQERCIEQVHFYCMCFGVKACQPTSLVLVHFAWSYGYVRCKPVTMLPHIAF